MRNEQKAVGRRYPRLALVMAGVLFVALLIVALTHPALRDDEAAYHYPLAAKFAAELPAIDVIHGYTSAYPPFPYVLAAGVLRVFGPNPLHLRVLNFLVGIATIVSLWMLCRKAGLRHVAWIAALALLAQPYFVRDSLTFFPTLYGILFSIWAFYFLLDDRPASTLLVGLFLMLSLLSHQWAAACYLVVSAWWLYDFFRKPTPLGPRLRQLAFRAATLLVSLAPSSMLFLAWGGLAHPDFAAHQVGFRPGNIVFFGILMGVWFWPLAAQRLREFKPRTLALAAVAAAALIPLCPRWSDDLGPNLMPGIIMHITEVPGRLAPFLPNILRWGLLFVGLLSIAALLSERAAWTDVDRRALLFAGAGALILAFSVAISEKHYLFLFPFLLLVIVPRLRELRLTAAWLTLSGALTVTYFLYWLLLKLS